MKHLCYLLLALVAVMRRGAVVSSDQCDNNNAPKFLSVDCAILAEYDTDTPCRTNIAVDGRPAVDQCRGSRAVCQTYTGMGLNITCRVPGPGGNAVVSDDLEVHRDGRRLGNDTWSSFVTAEAEGRYECLWKANQSSFANRSVAVDDAVYIIWSDPSKHICRTFSIQLTDGVNRNCSKVDTTVYHSNLSPVPVWFNVLGARPISLSVDIVWVNHYPVTLDFFLSSHMALSDNISHSVVVSPDKLVFVAQQSVDAFLVVTGSTSNHSSSMCVHLTLLGNAVLFPNKSLPGNVTVTEGQPADFHCDVKTTRYGGLAFTVAIFFKPPSSNFTECFNRSFSYSDSHVQNNLKTNGSCDGLVLSNSSSGQNLDKMHHLTASWPHPSVALSGAEVLCAIASSGITQWAQTATLTILPSSPFSLPSLSTPVQPSSRHPELRALGAISLLLVAAVSFLGVLLWWRYRKQSSTIKILPKPDEIPLAQTSLPSSVANTPTTSHPLLPTITLPPSSSTHARLLGSSQHSSDSMDSGLSLGDSGEGSKVVVGGNQLQVTTGFRSTSLSDLFFSPSRDVCVYVSYCDSQV
jgi:hypothetical protein